MSALDAIADWPVPTAAAAVIGRPVCWPTRRHRAPVHIGVGDQAAGRARRQIAIEEGVLELDTPAGPPGFDGATSAGTYLWAVDAHRRGDGAAGTAPDLLELRIRGGSRGGGEEAGIEFGRYLAEAVFEPLGMASSELRDGADAAGYGATSTVADLALFAAELLRPALVSAADARRGH